MFNIIGDDVTDAFQRVINSMVWYPGEAIDLVKSPSIYSFDNLIRTKSCHFEWDLQYSGLTNRRWTRFMSQYVQANKLEKWLNGIGDQRRGIVNLFQSYGETKVRPSLHHPEEEGHKWGPCFLGIGFTFSPKPKMTLYSRTARLPTTATMELTLCHLLSKEIKARYHLQDEIMLTWFASSLHVTAWDVLPWLTYQKRIEEFVGRDDIPLAKFARRQYNKIVSLSEITRENVPYGRQRRISRRVKEMMSGKYLPPCPIDLLPLWKVDSVRKKKIKDVISGLGEQMKLEEGLIL